MVTIMASSASIISKTRFANDQNDGGQGRNRTADASLFRAALYRLSYLAIRRRKLEFSKPENRMTEREIVAGILLYSQSRDIYVRRKTIR